MACCVFCVLGDLGQPTRCGRRPLFHSSPLRGVNTAEVAAQKSTPKEYCSAAIHLARCSDASQIQRARYERRLIGFEYVPGGICVSVAGSSKAAARVSCVLHTYISAVHGRNCSSMIFGGARGFVIQRSRVLCRLCSTCGQAEPLHPASASGRAAPPFQV